MQKHGKTRYFCQIQTGALRCPDRVSNPPTPPSHPITVLRNYIGENKTARSTQEFPQMYPLSNFLKFAVIEKLVNAIISLKSN
jgi:hypothetical protein